MRVKILHIMQSLEVGGMENGVVNIVNNIDAQFSSQIYCTKKIGNLAKKLKNRNALIYEGEYPGLLKSTLRLFFYCVKNRPDVLHSHGWGTLITSFFVSKILRIKLVHGEHGTVYFKRKKDRVVQKLMLKRTKINLFVSATLRDLFVDKLNIDSTNKVVYNGVDTERFKPVSNREQRDSNKILIGTIGRLVPVKNQLWLIDVLSSVLNENINLMIVGSGPLDEDLKNKVKKLGLESRVILYGESSEPEVLMNDFDVFVLPSISEGLSNTILEAMATKLPIIAADVGGNSELVIDDVNGVLYNSNDKIDFLSKLNPLLNDEIKRKKFSDASLCIVLNKFKIDVMIKNYQDVYVNAMK